MHRKNRITNGLLVILIMTMCAWGIKKKQVSISPKNFMSNLAASKRDMSKYDNSLKKSSSDDGGDNLPDTASEAKELMNIEWNGDPKQQIQKVNNGKPDFDANDLSLSNGSWQKFSNLDRLNRVGTANALLGKDLMPKGKRQSIATVTPTGFHNKRIIIAGKHDWLYNRSHLIGYQLTGENANPKNLMTGTRSLNTPAMEYYESEIAQYIKNTNHHVRYRVVPVFRGNELVARGVQMVGESVEDKKISFNVFILNVQKDYTINYLTGLSRNK